MNSNMPLLTGEAKIAGVLGWPVSHSRSPKLHGYWLKQYGIDGAYIPLPVRPEDFPSVLHILPKLGLRGCNVTIPHKEAAASNVDHLDSFAKRVGAVNTIIVRDDGSLEGRNTDGFGFIENLKHGMPGFRFSNGAAVVLGAGGAARAIVAALSDAGVPEIKLINRNLSKAEALARALGGSIHPRPWSDIAAALGGANLLVNTTSLGMTGQPDLDVGLESLPTTALVTDIVYAPLETAFLRKAKERGNPIVDGIGMLLHQARPGFQAWFGVMPTVTPELRAHVLGDL